MTDAAIDALREQIAEVDRTIVSLLNARLELVAELKEVKQASGLAFVDLDRERRLLEHLTEMNSGPLSDDGVRALHRAILELTKRELGEA